MVRQFLGRLLATYTYKTNTGKVYVEGLVEGRSDWSTDTHAVHQIFVLVPSFGDFRRRAQTYGGESSAIIPR